MRNPAAAISILILSLALAGPLTAHNVNMDQLERLVEVRLREGGLDLRLTLQYREFPGLAVRAAMDRDGSGIIDEREAEEYARVRVDSLLDGFALSLDGTPLKLIPLEDPKIDLYSLPRIVPQHLDLVYDFTAPLESPASGKPAGHLEIENGNRWPWPGRETFVLVAGRGLDISRTSLDSLTSPVASASLEKVWLDCSLRGEKVIQQAIKGGEGAWRIVIDRWAESGSMQSRPSVAIVARENTPARDSESRFHQRVLKFFAAGETSRAGLWLLILAAFIYGCFHALEPGHAKTVTAVYLIGSGHRWPRALFLALTVTLTHTGGVLILALLTSLVWGGSLSQNAQTALSGFSGLIVLLLGIQRLRAGGHVHADEKGHSHAGHTHPHTHPHEQPHEHNHSSGSRWELIWLGVAGGLMPCPGALWIYFLAVGFGQPGLAVVLILALSLGLALVLVTVGLVSLYLRDRVQAGEEGPPDFVARSRWLSLIWSRGARLGHLAPSAAGILLVLLGSFMLWRSLMALGLIGS